MTLTAWFRYTEPDMNQLLWVAIAGSALSSAGLAQPKTPFLGRWDINVTTPQATYPDWMEITEKDGALEAYIQPRSGGARRTKEVKPDGSRIVITTPQGQIWDLKIDGDKFTGVQKRGEDTTAQLAGVRAPKLDRPMPARWTDPEPLFNAKDLSGWEVIPGRPSKWVVKDGELINEGAGANLKSTRKFDDFKLHFDVNCPENGNSGIYLRGRYEMQIEYVPGEDRFHMMGAIYSHVAPTADVPRKPGEWETWDITLVGRRVTIVRSGVKTIDNQEIPGITGGALDANEGEPGAFYIQGDHGGILKFRNMTISVPRK